MAQGCGLLMLLLALGSVSDGSQAQSYPTKPIRLHTAGAGGTADVLTRLIAPPLGISLGQSVIVDNRPVGPILAMSVANAAPDGYTLLLWGNPFWIGPLVEPQPFDVFRDFAPVAGVARATSILVVTPSLPVKSVEDLIRLAKARPGELNYSAGSTGSTPHIGAELFKSMAGVDIVRITYKGGPQEMTDLMSGQVQVTVGGGTGMAPHIKAGKLRALATGGSGRSLLFPDLPTVAETLPGYVAEQLYVMVAPKKTPEGILRRVNQEVVRVLEKGDLREKLLNSGLEPMGGPPEELAGLIKAEVDRASKIIKAAGIR